MSRKAIGIILLFPGVGLFIVGIVLGFNHLRVLIPLAGGALLVFIGRELIHGETVADLRSRITSAVKGTP